MIKLHSYESSGKDILSFMSMVGIVIMLRRFLISEKGYMGLGPAKALPGDLICVLLGGRVPYILRKISAEFEHEGIIYPCYKLLDDLYVHGLMDGAAMEMIEKGQTKVEKLVLV